MLAHLDFLGAGHRLAALMALGEGHDHVFGAAQENADVGLLGKRRLYSGQHDGGSEIATEGVDGNGDGFRH